MKHHSNKYIIQKKKNYSKPTLTILGKVSELTAGGSQGAPECTIGPQGMKCKPDPHNKKARS